MENFTNFEPFEEIDTKTKRSIPFTKIFVTNYYWEVPYLIDIKKYKQIAGNNAGMDNENTASLTFSCEIDEWFTLFAFTNNKNSDSWHYDCFQKGKFHDGCTFEEFKNWTTKLLTESIIGVDKNKIDELISNKQQQINNINKEIQLLNSVKSLPDYTIL